MLSSLHNLIHFVNVAITAGVDFTVTVVVVVVVITLAVTVTVPFFNAIRACVHHYATIMLQPTMMNHSNTY